MWQYANSCFCREQRSWWRWAGWLLSEEDNPCCSLSLFFSSSPKAWSCTTHQHTNDIRTSTPYFWNDLWTIINTRQVTYVLLRYQNLRRKLETILKIIVWQPAHQIYTLWQIWIQSIMYEHETLKRKMSSSEQLVVFIVFLCLDVFCPSVIFSSLRDAGEKENHNTRH